MVKTIGPKADQLEWLKTTGPKADRLWAALEGGDGVGPTLLREFFGGRSRLHAMVSDLERYYRGERECARIRHQEANNPNRVEDSGLRGDRESIISITSSEPPATTTEERTRRRAPMGTRPIPTTGTTAPSRRLPG